MGSKASDRYHSPLLKTTIDFVKISMKTPPAPLIVTLTHHLYYVSCHKSDLVFPQSDFSLMDEVVLHVKQHVEKIANSWHHSKQAHQKAAYTCIMLEVVLTFNDMRF